jgi:hypothetical protein
MTVRAFSLEMTAHHAILVLGRQEKGSVDGHLS